MIMQATMMHTALMSICILILALPQLSISLSFKTSQHIASFNDIQPDFNSPNSINLYESLYWSKFVQYTPSSDQNTRHGIAASSPPVHALSASNLYNIFGFPTTHTGLEFTGISFFDLQSFSWGCLVLNPATHMPLQPETPANCSLSIQCLRPEATAAVESQSNENVLTRPGASGVYFFIVSPAMKIWSVQMAEVNLGGWFRACQSITWDVRALAGGGGREVALALDDVKYKTYRVTKWDWKGLGEIVHENGPYGIA